MFTNILLRTYRKLKRISFLLKQLEVHPYTPEEEEPESVVDLTSDEPIEEIRETSSSETFNAESHTVELENLYRIKFTYEGIPKINVCLAAKTSEKSPEKTPSVNLCTPPRISEKLTEEKQSSLTSILKKVTNSLDKVPAKKKRVNFLLPTTPQIRTSPRFTAQLKSTQEISSRSTFLLSQKFFIVIETFFTNYIKNLTFRDVADRLLIGAFEWTKSFDIYLKLIQQSVMISKKRQNETSAACGSTETAGKPKKHVSSSEEYSKRLHRKLTENQKLIMHNDDKNTIEKDCSYAYNYLDRVKKTLIDCGDDGLYTEFMSMLTSFDPDRESVPELYHVSPIKLFVIPGLIKFRFNRKWSTF